MRYKPVCVSACVCVCVCVCVRVFLCAYLSVLSRICVRRYLFVFVLMCVRACVRTYVLVGYVVVVISRVFVSVICVLYKLATPNFHDKCTLQSCILFSRFKNLWKTLKKCEDPFL